MSNRCQYKQLGVQCALDADHRDDDGNPTEHMIPTEGIMQAVMAGHFGDKEVITKDDEKRPITRAEFKRYRQRTLNDLNLIVRTFHEELVRKQVLFNHAWNSMNAILRAFLDAGVIEESDIARAGERLMDEHRRNLEVAEEAAKKKEMVDHDRLSKTPLDSIKEVMYGKRS